MLFSLRERWTCRQAAIGEELSSCSSFSEKEDIGGTRMRIAGSNMTSCCPEPALREPRDSSEPSSPVKLNKPPFYIVFLTRVFLPAPLLPSVLNRDGYSQTKAPVKNKDKASKLCQTSKTGHCPREQNPIITAVFPQRHSGFVR